MYNTLENYCNEFSLIKIFLKNFVVLSLTLSLDVQIWLDPTQGLNFLFIKTYQFLRALTLCSIFSNQDNRNSKFCKIVQLLSIQLMNFHNVNLAIQQHVNLKMPTISCQQFTCLSQSGSCVQIFATPWNEACQASLSITNSWSLLKLKSIELVMPSNHLILCHPLLLLPSLFPSIRVFSSESVLCIRWPKYWSFSFSISPSSEYSGLISFRMDWLDLLAVQETLKSLLQHHSSKSSILWHSL